MRVCPKCGSNDVSTERRIGGNSRCNSCKYEAKTEKFDASVLKEDYLEKMVDLFLQEAMDEVPEIQNDSGIKRPVNPKPPVTQPVEPPMEEEPPTDETPPEIEEPLTKDIVKYDNIDLNIVNPKTSKFFSFDALRNTLKSINSLLDIQDKLVLLDDNDITNLREIKDKTNRLKLIILKYIANFKSYEQEEIDTIRPIFEKIALGLSKETKIMAKKIN